VLKRLRNRRGGTYERVKVRLRSSFHVRGDFEKGRKRMKEARIVGTRTKRRDKRRGKSERGILPNPGLGLWSSGEELVAIVTGS
jgi:hypothetical protein